MVNLTGYVTSFWFLTAVVFFIVGYATQRWAYFDDGNDPDDSEIGLWDYTDGQGDDKDIKCDESNEEKTFSDSQCESIQSARSFSTMVVIGSVVAFGTIAMFYLGKLSGMRITGLVSIATGVGGILAIGSYAAFVMSINEDLEDSGAPFEVVYGYSFVLFTIAACGNLVVGPFALMYGGVA